MEDLEEKRRERCLEDVWRICEIQDGRNSWLIRSLERGFEMGWWMLL